MKEKLMKQLDYLAPIHQIDVEQMTEHIASLSMDELEKRFIGERMATISTSDTFNDEELLEKRTLQRMIIRMGWELDKK